MASAFPSHARTPLFRRDGGSNIAASIFPLHRIPANPQDICKHAQAVADGMNAGAFSMRPRYRNFRHNQVVLASKVQEFRIEAPPLDLLVWEDLVGSLPGKSFESALGVFIVQAKNQTESQVEDAAEYLAIKRLAPNLQLGTNPARADRDISSSRDCGKEFVGLRNWRGEIRIAEEKHFTMRVQHAVAHAKSLASISRILDQA